MITVVIPRLRYPTMGKPVAGVSPVMMIMPTVRALNRPLCFSLFLDGDDWNLAVPTFDVSDHGPRWENLPRIPSRSFCHIWSTRTGVTRGVIRDGRRCR